MAKRTNRKKNTSDSDDKTIIKVTRSKPESQPKNRNSRNAKSPESKKTPRSTSNRSANTKSETNKRTPKKASPPKTTESSKSITSPSKTTSSTSGQKASEPATAVTNPNREVNISQTVAVLIDGNNIEMSLTKLTSNKSAVINFDTVIPKLLHGRGLNRLIYFREGRSISQKLADRLHTHYFGSVVPCHKSADIPLSIKATQLAEKVDTIIILSGDSDYVELVRHLKSQGVRVEIAAVEMTTADILIKEADYYSPITKEDAFILK